MMMEDEVRKAELVALEVQLAQLKAAKEADDHPMDKQEIAALSEQLERRRRHLENFKLYVTPTFNPARTYGISFSRLASDFLDGHTFTGAVGLAPHAEAPFTGTWWQFHVMEEIEWGAPHGTPAIVQILSIYTAGSGGIFHYLDGNTGNGAVGLAPTTGSWYTGTRWRVGLMTDPVSGFTARTLRCMAINAAPGQPRYLGVRDNKVQLLHEPVPWWIMEL